MNVLPQSALINRVNVVLKQHGLGFDVLAKSTDQIILFGSWAAGVQRRESDIDVLCVGEGTRLKSPSLDLIWIGRDQIHEPTWLGSELATHIAGYGVWLTGTDKWSSKTHASKRAIERKTRRLVSLLHALEVCWHDLALPLKRRYARSFSRDLLRLEYLLTSSPVPPTAMIDNQLSSKGSLEILRGSAAVRLHHSLRSHFARTLLAF